MFDIIYPRSLKETFTNREKELALLEYAREELLAGNPPQIARKLRIAQGAVRNYLNSLINVDIVTRKEDKYYFRDPILRYWVAATEQEIELDEFPRQEDILSLEEIH